MRLIKKIYTLLPTFILAFSIFGFSYAQAQNQTQTIFTSGDQAPATSEGTLGQQGTELNLNQTQTSSSSNSTTTSTSTASTSTSTFSFTCNSSIKTLADLFGYATCLIGKGIIPLLFSAALVIFIYGVIQYVLNPASSTKREEGGKYMMWGILALFVMVSVWGLVNVLVNTFGLNSSMPVVPHFTM